MLELVQRGASPDEAEGVVRTLGATFVLDAADQADVAAQKRVARGAIASGVGLVVGGVGLMLFVLSGSTRFAANLPLAAGAMILSGLTLIAKNVGTT